MTSLQNFRDRLPLLAAQEGVWAGYYRRVDPLGQKFSEHRSRVIIRYKDTIQAPHLYNQTNIYWHTDGKIEIIDTGGNFEGDRITFSNERSSGWAMDEPCDPERRTCLMVITFHADAGVYKSGMRLYEMIQVSACGKFRSRVTQFIQDGRILMRTLIDEEKISDHWDAADQELAAMKALNSKT